MADTKLEVVRVGFIPGARCYFRPKDLCLITIEVAMPELSDLNSPEFAAIKSRFARAYLDHKADIGAPHATDQDILDHVDDITALMLGALGRAMAERRHTWLQHYGWFTDLVIELLDDQPGKPLDG